MLLRDAPCFLAYKIKFSISDKLPRVEIVRAWYGRLTSEDDLCPEANSLVLQPPDEARLAAGSN